jgi:hypothetical protein
MGLAEDIFTVHIAPFCHALSAMAVFDPERPPWRGDVK